MLWRRFCSYVWNFYRNFTARSVLWRIVTLLWCCCVYWKANIDNNIVLLPKSFFSSYRLFSKPTSIILCTSFKGHYLIKISSFEFILDPNLIFLWLFVLFTYLTECPCPCPLQVIYITCIHIPYVAFFEYLLFNYFLVPAISLLLLSAIWRKIFPILSLIHTSINNTTVEWINHDHCNLYGLLYCHCYHRYTYFVLWCSSYRNKKYPVNKG